MMRNNFSTRNIDKQSGKIWVGLGIVAFGLLLLLDNIGLDIPNWIFKWHTFLLVIGLFVGAKDNFRGNGWFIMVLIGAYFTLDRIMPDLDMGKVVFPIALVILGLFLILRPRSRKYEPEPPEGDKSQSFDQYTEVTSDDTVKSKSKNYSGYDYIDSVNVFGGSHQNIFSKNFKGGQILAVFGGCDVNLTQADFEHQVEIEVTTIFGGAKIIVPPGWEVKSEVSAIFGGLDDKRSIQPLSDAPRKLLIIKGVALFGGVDIRNY